MAAGISTRNRATMENSSLLLQVESLCGATGCPLRTPRLEDTVLEYTWPLELAREIELQWKNHLFCCKLKACAEQRVTLFERLDWKTPCLMHTLANQLRSSQKYTWVFYASVDGLSLGTIRSWHNSSLKSAWRDHTRCSVQIITKST